jgi:hypothetical protein
MINNKKGRLVVKNDILTYDWGTVTPEFYNDEQKIVVHVFNHFLEGQVNAERSIRFAYGRIQWFKNHVPHGSIHEILFDDRGQKIDDLTRNQIVSRLEPVAQSVKFMSWR